MCRGPLVCGNRIPENFERNPRVRERDFILITSEWDYNLNSRGANPVECPEILEDIFSPPRRILFLRGRGRTPSSLTALKYRRYSHIATTPTPPDRMHLHTKKIQSASITKIIEFLAVGDVVSPKGFDLNFTTRHSLSDARNHLASGPRWLQVCISHLTRKACPYIFITAAASPGFCDTVVNIFGDEHGN